MADLLELRKSDHEFIAAQVPSPSTHCGLMSTWRLALNQAASIATLLFIGTKFLIVAAPPPCNGTIVGVECRSCDGNSTIVLVWESSFLGVAIFGYVGAFFVLVVSLCGMRRDFNNVLRLRYGRVVERQRAVDRVHAYIMERCQPLTYHIVQADV